MMPATLRSRGSRNTDDRDSGLGIGKSRAGQGLRLDKPDELNSLMQAVSNHDRGERGNRSRTGCCENRNFQGPDREYEANFCIRHRNEYSSLTAANKAPEDRIDRMTESSARLSNTQDLFSLSDEHREVLDHADKFARNELAPLATRMDADEWWPSDAFPKIGNAGFFGLTVSPEYGGVGSDLFTSGLVLQAFSRWNHALALSWVAHDNLCLNNIYRNASD